MCLCVPNSTPAPPVIVQLFSRITITFSAYVENFAGEGWFPWFNEALGVNEKMAGVPVFMTGHYILKSWGREKFKGSVNLCSQKAIFLLAMTADLGWEWGRCSHGWSRTRGKGWHFPAESSSVVSDTTPSLFWPPPPRESLCHERTLP